MSKYKKKCFSVNCHMSFVYILTPKISLSQKTHRWKSNMPSTKCQKLKHFCKKILMSNLTLSNVGNRCRIVHDVKPGCLLTWRPLETLMRKSQNWQSSCVRAAPAYTHLLRQARAAVSVLSSVRGAVIAARRRAASAGGRPFTGLQLSFEIQAERKFRTKTISASKPPQMT